MNIRTILNKPFVHVFKCVLYTYLADNIKLNMFYFKDCIQFYLPYLYTLILKTNIMVQQNLSV